MSKNQSQATPVLTVQEERDCNPFGTAADIEALQRMTMDNPAERFLTWSAMISHARKNQDRAARRRLARRVTA